MVQTKSSVGNKIKLLSLFHCDLLLLLFCTVVLMLSIVSSPTVAAVIAAPLSLIITVETGDRVDR